MAVQSNTRLELGHGIVMPNMVVQNTSFGPYSAAQRAQLKATFPSAETMTRIDFLECVLLPTPPVPLTVATLRKSSLLKHFYQAPTCWYEDFRVRFSFEEELPPATWFAFRRTKVQSAKSHVIAAQLRELQKLGLEPALAVLALYATFLYLEVRKGVALYKDVEFRTASVDRIGEHITIGPFGAQGMPVKQTPDNERSPQLNIASHLPL